MDGNGETTPFYVMIWFLIQLISNHKKLVGLGVPGRCSELPLPVGSVSSERSKKTEGFFSKTPGHGNWPRFWAMFFERADVGVTRVHPWRGFFEQLLIFYKKEWVAVFF